MPKYRHFIYAALFCAMPLFLQACASDFSFSDPKTWHFESEKMRQAKELREACQKQYADKQNQRVVSVNGVDETYYHDECLPYTQTPPKYINRMEGR